MQECPICKSKMVSAEQGSPFFVRKPEQATGLLLHRYGWPDVLQAIYSENNWGSKEFILDDYVDHTFSNRPKIYLSDWIGIFHHPPTPQNILDGYFAENILQNDHFQASLPKLKVGITLSNYLKDWYSDRLDIQFFSLQYPCESKSSKRWSIESFESNPNKTLGSLGFFCRNTHILSEFPQINGFCKKVFFPNAQWIYNWHERIKGYRDRPILDSFEVSKIMIPEKYDEFLTENIVVCDFIGASGITVLNECVIHNTPIICNPHPAVVEVLGKDYPLYYKESSEIPTLIKNEVYIDAHTYISKLDKSRFSQEFFIEELKGIINAYFK